MLCYVMLCYVMLCYVMLCYMILYHIILYSILQYIYIVSFPLISGGYYTNIFFWWGVAQPWPRPIRPGSQAARSGGQMSEFLLTAAQGPRESSHFWSYPLGI